MIRFIFSVNVRVAMLFAMMSLSRDCGKVMLQEQILCTLTPVDSVVVTLHEEHGYRFQQWFLQVRILYFPSSLNGFGLPYEEETNMDSSTIGNSSYVGCCGNFSVQMKKSKSYPSIHQSLWRSCPFRYLTFVNILEKYPIFNLKNIY